MSYTYHHYAPRFQPVRTTKTIRTKRTQKIEERKEKEKKHALLPINGYKRNVGLRTEKSFRLENKQPTLRLVVQT